MPWREMSRMKTRSPPIFPAKGSSSFTRCRRRRSNCSVTTADQLTTNSVNPSFVMASEMRERTFEVLLRVRSEGSFVCLGRKIEDLVLVLHHRCRRADGDLAAVDRIHGDGRRERQRRAHRLILRGGGRRGVGLG